MAPELEQVKTYFTDLQDRIAGALEQVGGGGTFREDLWTREAGGGGRSRVMEGDEVFEKAGVNFSHVSGDGLPASSTAHRGELAGSPFQAMGVSLVIHPRNPFVPTTHMNVRFFSADTAKGPIWWFGGGFDLTPYYPFHEDVVFWHQQAQAACQQFDPTYYQTYKAWCDRYFFLKHRQETRGVGGLFFDDLQGDFEHAFGFTRSVGNTFTKAYLPIVERRKDTPYCQAQRDFQLYRRGRYVEFNLVYDRGTLFGLQTGGRTESILMSLPPLVAWHYDFQPEPDSAEARLVRDYLRPRDWLDEAEGPGQS